MKKILLFLLLTGSTCALFAQDTDNDTKKGKMKIKSKPNDQNGTTDMKVKVKGNPANVNGNMMNNGMSTGMSSSTTTTTTVSIGGWTTNPPSLPVVGTDVSTTVVANLKTKFGATLYDIKKIRSSSGQDIYAIRLMNSGQLSLQYVDDNGNTVSQ